MQWLFFGPALLIARWPDAGLLIALVGITVQLALTWRAGGPFDRNFFRQAPVFAGLLWLIFGFYESQMQAVTVRASLSSGANPALRLDLMVLTPILYLLTAAAVHSAIRQLWTKK